MNWRDPMGFVRSRFLREAATLQVSGLLNQSSQLISSVFLAFLLGSHGMGLLTVAVMLQSLLFNVVFVGIVQATVSQVAAGSAREKPEKVAAWLAFVVKFYLVFSVVLIALGAWALPWMGESWYENRELGLWAWWLTFWIPIDTPRAVSQVAFQGTRRMLALAQLDNGQELIRMFLVCLGALVTGSAMGAVLGEIASRILSAYLALHMYSAARRDGGPPLPSMRELFRRVPEIPLWQGMQLGLRVGVIKNTTTLVVTILPRLLLGGYASFSWVAYFHVAQRIMGIPLMLMQGVSRTILPALSELRGRHDLVGFRRMYTRTTVFTGLAIALGIVLALPGIRPLVALVYPPDYARPVFLCCGILGIGVVISAFGVAQDPFYILTDRMRQNLAICLVGALVTIPANMLLVNVMPETGPVWGQTLYLSWVLVHFVYIARYFRREAHTAQWS